MWKLLAACALYSVLPAQVKLSLDFWGVAHYHGISQSDVLRGGSMKKILLFLRGELLR